MPDTVRFPIPAAELPVLRRGLEQLQAAIRAMTAVVFDLESTTSGVVDEQQRFYRISEAGRVVLDALRKAFNGDVQSLPSLLEKVDRFLAGCSQVIAEREAWRDHVGPGKDDANIPEASHAKQGYRSWSEEEEKELMQGFDSGLSIAALAQKHGRSEGAIRSRLQKLGKISWR